MNQDRLNSPNYGKFKAKRGRKYLKGLRGADEKEKEKKKIIFLLNVGKGKILPKAT